MISPLVYLFAGAGFAVALVFGASALLTYRHARTRSKRASDLGDYIAGRLPRQPARREEAGTTLVEPIPDPVARRHEQRTRVMHVTIGDLIRDEKLAAAATEGADEARAQAAELLAELRLRASGPGDSGIT